MPGAIDSTGQLVDLPPDALEAAWKDRKVDLVAGQNYNVRTLRGQWLSVPAEKVAEHLSSGARMVSDADVAEHHEAQEYGGARGKAIAFGAGALEQGTLGVGSELLPEDWHAPIEASRRQNPLTYGVGQVGGSLALSAAIPGGGAAGLLERGAATALEGVGESTMARIAARAAVGAAKDAALGLQFGASKAISDNAIADHKLTAEQMLGELKTDTLWGGALGAVAGGIGGVFRAGRGAAERALTPAETPVGRALATGASDADVASVAAKIAGAEGAPAEGLGAKVRAWFGKLGVKASSLASGGSAEDIENVFKNRAELLEAESVREKAAAEIREHVDTVLRESDAVQDQYKGSLKRGHLKASTAEVDKDAAAQASRTLADKALAQLDEMAKNPEDYGAPSDIKKTIKAAMKYSTQLDAAIGAGDVAEQYGLLDDMKRAIGRPAKAAARLDPSAARTEWDVLQTRARSEGLESIHEDLRKGLEDETTWKKAAVDQQQINQAWTTHIDASRRFHKALTTEGARTADQGFGRNPRIVDPEKVDSYVRNILNPAKDLTHKAVGDYVDSARTLSDIMGRSLSLSDADASSVAQVVKGADAFKSAIDKAANGLTLQNQFEALRNATAGHAQNWGAVVGAVTHGLSGVLPGMAVGKVADLLTHPAETAMKLARIEQLARSSDSRVLRALRGFGRADTKSSATLPLDSYARKAAQVQTLSNHPELLQQRIAANLGTLHGHAPKLAAAMTQTALAGLALLRDKLPPVLETDPLDPTRKPPMPSDGARHQWLRYYAAVRDPDSVVEDLRAGRLSPEGVEVLQTAFPAKYERLQNTVMQEVASGRMKDLSTQQRMGLGILLDLPLPELAPEYVAQRQAVYAQQAQAAQTQGETAQKPGGKRRPVDLSKRAAPPMLAAEKVEQGART